MKRFYNRPSKAQKKFNFYANRMNSKNLRLYSFRGGIRL